MSLSYFLEEPATMVSLDPSGLSVESRESTQIPRSIAFRVEADLMIPLFWDG
jgi:hypothetical protein